MRVFTHPGGDGIPGVFLDRFRSAMDSGEIREHDASQTLITLMGSCIYFFAGYPILSTILPEIREDRDAYLQARKKHIFDILFFGLKPRPESFT
jgi:TetR/AcrR family transcriptional regulator